MSDALEDRKGSFSVGGRSFIYFCTADDIVVETEEEADGIVTSMGTTCTRYKMECVPT